RGDGEIARLGGRSLPLGLGLGEVFQEGAVRLEPGDRLLVYSDGLVDLRDQTVDERGAIDELLRAGDAEEMVQRLLGRVSANHADDVTVLVLRRLPAPAVAARGRVSRKASACT
ncbi:MAG TPA: SpoIIE family protein phosphatase, partial [Candidatus Dormibacteraeota bacterium]|nr:SpoIIE family protein phosphatase [Candidatus Dormibacteraeota bacterium]